MAKPPHSLNVSYYRHFAVVTAEKPLIKNICTGLYLYSSMALGVIPSFCHIKLGRFSPRLQEYSKGPVGTDQRIFGGIPNPWTAAHWEPGCASGR